MDNASALYALLLPGAITVRVIFNRPHADGGNGGDNIEADLQRRGLTSDCDRNWTYKAMAADGIKVGDLVLVDSPRNGIVAVTVVGLDEEPDLDFTSNIRYKWIIGRVPLEAYRQRLDREEQFRQGLVRLERDKRREALRKDLEERYGNVGALLGVDPLPPIDVPAAMKPLDRKPFAGEIPDGPARVLYVPTLGQGAVVVTTTTLTAAELETVVRSIQAPWRPAHYELGRTFDIWRDAARKVWWMARGDDEASSIHE